MKTYLKRLMDISGEYESHIRNIFRLSSRHLQSFKPVNLLDVGCGDGSRTLRLAKYFMIPAEHIHGLDSDPQRLIQCRQLFNVVLADIELKQRVHSQLLAAGLVSESKKDTTIPNDRRFPGACGGELQSGRLPYRDQMFDLVVCNQVFEHLKNYLGVLEDIMRVTKPGGYILVGIPNLAHLINRFYLLFGIQPMCIDIHSSHVRGFTHKAFEQTLKSTPGITYIDCEGSELIYPLPLHLAKPLSKMFVGICAYVCYLVHKE